MTSASSCLYVSSNQGGGDLSFLRISYEMDENLNNNRFRSRLDPMAKIFIPEKVGKLRNELYLTNLSSQGRFREEIDVNTGSYSLESEVVPMNTISDSR